MKLCSPVVKGAELGPCRFTSHLDNKNHITHLVPEHAQSDRLWEPSLDWRPQGLIGHDPKVLNVASLTGPQSWALTGHTVWNVCGTGTDTEMRRSQKNPLIWKGLKSAKGDKRKILVWVEGGACTGLGGKAKLPFLKIPMAPPHPSPSYTPDIHPAYDSQNNFSKM